MATVGSGVPVKRASAGRLKACFLGGARYSEPLDATSAKKFRALAALGEIFVVGFSQDMTPRRFTEHAHFYLLPKWPIPALRYLVMFVVGPWLALWLVLRYSVRVLVAQSPYEGSAAAWAKVMAGWLGWRVALVIESHGDFEESLFLERRVPIPWLYRVLMRRAARFALRHADVLRAVSNSTREQLSRWMPGRPVIMFPTWTDIEAFLEAGAHEVRDRAEIVYAGVLIPRKGVHHLIHAFGQVAPGFPEAKLLIIGREENPAYAAELKRDVAQLGLSGRVAFVGEMPQGELATRMRDGAVFVLPTYSEGLPRVVFEGMALGLPVIASRVSGIPEVIEEGVTGFLVPPGDEAALADRLRWVFANPEAARAIGKRAREFACSFFSTEAYVGGYRRFFAAAEEVVEGGRPGNAPSAL